MRNASQSFDLRKALAPAHTGRHLDYPFDSVQILADDQDANAWLTLVGTILIRSMCTPLIFSVDFAVEPLPRELGHPCSVKHCRVREYPCRVHVHGRPSCASIHGVSLGTNTLPRRSAAADWPELNACTLKLEGGPSSSSVPQSPSGTTSPSSFLPCALAAACCAILARRAWHFAVAWWLAQ